MRPGAGTVYRWELRKLVSQKRTYLGLAFVIGMPAIFTTVIAVQNSGPEEVPFGRYVVQSGIAVPLVLLTFGAYWMLPLVAALVAGDIFAAEDHNGTLKTILTRSLDRGQIFAGKTLVAVTYAALGLVVMCGVALLGGAIEAGIHPLTTLSGTTVSAGHGIALLGASMGVYFLPILAIAAIALLLSVATRNSAAAVVGTLMLNFVLQLVAILPGVGSVKPYLLTDQFFAWHGFLRDPIDWAPITHAAWVCPLWIVPPLVAAYLVFLRRDVAGG